MADYIIPIIIIAVLAVGIVKKVNCYDAFIGGAKQSFSLATDLFPFIAAMFMLLTVMRASGLDNLLVKWLSPPFRAIGIPSELVELVILRPFSGSGSLTLLEEIYRAYGADSYIGRCASIIMGSTETVFYVSAVYFSKTKIKYLGACIPIALFCSLVGCVLACWLCKVI